MYNKYICVSTKNILRIMYTAVYTRGDRKMCSTKLFSDQNSVHICYVNIL